MTHKRCSMTADQAKRFVTAMSGRIGLGFHPDTLFRDYVDYRTGKRLFSAAEARKLDAKMECAQQVIDVYAVGARLMRKQLRAGK